MFNIDSVPPALPHDIILSLCLLNRKKANKNHSKEHKDETNCLITLFEVKHSGKNDPFRRVISMLSETERQQTEQTINAYTKSDE